MGFRTRPAMNDISKAQRALEIAVADVYQPGSTFLAIFEETPLQAVDALIKQPEAFGRLRLRRMDSDRDLAINALINAAINLVKLDAGET